LLNLNSQLRTNNQPLLSITPTGERFQEIINLLSRHTLMAFYDPDEKIVQQGFRDTEFMYLISQGSCAVSIYDQAKTGRGLVDIPIRTLSVSDYFGEISLVYDGVRTATVTTTNYCTIGKLSGQILWEICVN